MKRKITLRLCLVAALSIALVTALLLPAFYQFFQNQVLSDLRTNATLISMGYEEKKAVSYLQKIGESFPALRLTLVDSEGQVLFDTDSDSASMDSHADRSEIAQAQALGEGSTMRQSETLGTMTYYYAIRLSDGSVLRTALATHSVWSVFDGIFSIVFWITLGVFVLCVPMARMLANRVLKPLNELSEHMDNIGRVKIYDELSPFVHKIKEQNQNIRIQMEQLEAERNKIELLNENMAEGMVLMDTDKSILSINPSAARMLSGREADYVGKNILVTCRNPLLSEQINRALEGHAASATMEQDGRYIRLSAGPVRSPGSWVISGVLLMVMDVTEQVAAERSRQDFTANVSHELKTPLTSISGYAELIETGMARSEDVAEFAGKIHSEASRLLQLINDIIRLSQLDGPQMAGEFAPLDLSSIASESVTTLELLAAKKQVELICRKDGGPVMVSGSHSMLGEMAFNLIDNAIRYTPSGGKVEVEVFSDGGQAVLQVRDNGIGIPLDQQARVFERFYRVDKSRSKATGGTGLGLSIVKHVVEQHKGSIKLISAPDQGTTIIVRIPLLQQEDSEA